MPLLNEDDSHYDLLVNRPIPDVAAFSEQGWFSEAVSTLTEEVPIRVEEVPTTVEEVPIRVEDVLITVEEVEITGEDNPFNLEKENPKSKHSF